MHVEVHVQVNDAQNSYAIMHAGVGVNCKPMCIVQVDDSKIDQYQP